MTQEIIILYGTERENMKRETALDGIRGIMAVIVFIGHYLPAFAPQYIFTPESAIEKKFCCIASFGNR